jgi:hypothetical protein
MLKGLIILILLIILSGCAEKTVVATIFLKETNRQLVDLNGNVCLQDGFELLREQDAKHYDLITFYKDCSVHELRQLEEYEIPIWKPKPEEKKPYEGHE